MRLYLEPIPNIFKFLNFSSEIRSDYEESVVFDLFIAMDCGDEKRLGNAARYFQEAKHTACIDHHVSNQSFAEENYIFPDASSTCELICELLDTEKITKEIAECLYTGMVTDTGVFQYSCTSSSTMNMAGMLMDKGIDFTKIVDEAFNQKTYNHGTGTAFQQTSSGWQSSDFFSDARRDACTRSSSETYGRNRGADAQYQRCGTCSIPL